MQINEYSITGKPWSHKKWFKEHPIKKVVFAALLNC